MVIVYNPLVLRVASCMYESARRLAHLLEKRLRVHSHHQLLNAAA
jgi:hypothetical protein